VVPIRGNVDTRLRLVATRDVDAIVVARAGLARLGRLDDITETIDPLQMLPAPAQGALALEVRRSRPSDQGALRGLYEALAALDDVLARVCVDAERAVLGMLEAGCRAPLGALAEVAESDDGSEIYLRTIALATDGSHAVRCTGTGPVLDPVGLATRVARDLLDRGAAELVGQEWVGR
jgi:hydroxymethylbilane synthase